MQPCVQISSRQFHVSTHPQKKKKKKKKKKKDKYKNQMATRSQLISDILFYIFIQKAIVRLKDLLQIKSNDKTISAKFPFGKDENTLIHTEKYRTKGVTQR
jgi:hypothetical protein